MFIRTRLIRGRHYLYAEERWRDGGKTMSRSTYIGPLDAIRLLANNIFEAPTAHELSNDRAIERMEAEAVERRAKEEDVSREQAVFDERMYAAYGMKPAIADPVPIEKGEPCQSAPSEPSEQSPSEAPASEPSGEPE